jgi:hypothetical protein
VSAHIAKDNSNEIAYYRVAKRQKVPAEIATRCIASFSSSAYARSNALEQFSREEKCEEEDNGPEEENGASWPSI